MCKETSRTQTAVVRYHVHLIDERIHGWKPHNTINTRLAPSSTSSHLCVHAMLLLRMRMRMRMRMKMVGKVNRKGEPTPFFCVLPYSDLQSKKDYDSKDRKQRGWGADRLQSRWLIGRPWEGILNIENIATPFSWVNIKSSDWRRWKGFCQCTATTGIPTR